MLPSSCVAAIANGRFVLLLQLCEFAFADCRKLAVASEYRRMLTACIIYNSWSLLVPMCHY